MKILVTGSKGVVGTWLSKILSERGNEVFGIDLFHSEGESGWQREMSSVDCRYCRCDISNYRQLEIVFEKYGPFDIVYNAAAEFGRWNGEDYYEQLWRTNVIGTKNIIRMQERLGFKLVHFSSSEVYGDYQFVMREDVMDNVEIKQLNDYAMTKWVNEMQIGNSHTQFNTDSVIVRLFNTYGPGEWYHPYRSVNCKFCYNALNGIKTIVYKGHTRTSSYLEDVCKTLSNISENFISGRKYNIGGGAYHSIEEVADIIWDYCGADRNLLEYRDSEDLTTIDKKVCNILSKNEIGHTETMNLKDGLVNTIEWMKKYYGK